MPTVTWVAGLFQGDLGAEDLGYPMTRLTSALEGSLFCTNPNPLLSNLCAYT
jgi:hypothetical protein